MNVRASLDNLEESLKLIRRLQAIMATESLQQKSAEKGLDQLSLEEINDEIQTVRRKRKK